jgi:hypothetical protein
MDLAAVRLTGGHAHRLPYAVATCTLALALAGAALAADLLLRGAHASEPSAHDAASTATETSFGSIRVLGAAKAGVAREGHGGSHARARRVELVVRIALASRLDRAVIFSPGQFRLRTEGGARTIALWKARPRTEAIAPRKSLLLRLSFLAPRSAAGFSLQFDDLGRARPLLIELDPQAMRGGPVHDR